MAPRGYKPKPEHPWRRGLPPRDALPASKLEVLVFSGMVDNDFDSCTLDDVTENLDSLPQNGET